MRRVALLTLAVAILASPAAQAASTPRVDVMVVGRSKVLQDPVTVSAKPASLRVRGRSCSVAAGTPLAALEGARRMGGPSFSLRDYGACSTRASDASGLFVYKLGPDRNRGQDGWVYKVGRKAGSTSAGDASGPFGTGRRLKSGSAVTWFWCMMGAQGCQRTLEVRPAAATVAPGGSLSVTVRGYDDQGRGVIVAGATVNLGAATAITGADGGATLTAPPSAGRVKLGAQAAGMVRAFPVAVVVG
jgi:hypothetical protein